MLICYILYVSTGSRKNNLIPPVSRGSSGRTSRGWTTPSDEGYTEVMTIMRCGEMLEILLRRSGASWDKWLSENSHGGKICST